MLKQIAVQRSLVNFTETSAALHGQEDAEHAALFCLGLANTHTPRGVSKYSIPFRNP